jgi:hypothetical protein
MGLEPYLSRGSHVICLASLRNLGSVLIQQTLQAVRWTHDRDMPGFVRIGALINHYNQIPLIRQ